MLKLNQVLTLPKPVGYAKADTEYIVESISKHWVTLRNKARGSATTERRRAIELVQNTYARRKHHEKVRLA